MFFCHERKADTLCERSREEVGLVGLSSLTLLLTWRCGIPWLK